MVDIGLSVAKYLLFIFNFIFSLIGVTIIGVSVFMRIDVNDYSIFLEKYFSAAFYIVIAIGFIIFLVSFLGCCGAITENTCMLLSFSIMMMIAFSIQIAIGLFVVESSDQLDEIVEKGLNETLNGIKNDEKLYVPWDLLQNNLECCGVNSPSDWKAITGEDAFVPPSCCQKPYPSTCIISDASQQGCKESMTNFLKNHVVTLLSIVFGITLFQVLGIVFSCCMFSVFRRRTRTLDRI